jgi:hypothetical protein
MAYRKEVMREPATEVARRHKELGESRVRRRTTAAKAHREEKHEHADQVVGEPALRCVVHAAAAEDGVFIGVRWRLHPPRVRGSPGLHGSSRL